MRLIRMGAASLNQTPLDWEGNYRHVMEVLAEARRREVQVVCLPELCLTGYGCEDAFLSPNTLKRAAGLLESVKEGTRGMIVSVGLPVMFQNGIFNTACLLVDGTIAGFVAKQYLAGDGIHYEPRWFKAWESEVQHEVVWLDGKRYPFGDYVFDCGGVRLGFEICEDAWVARRPGSSLALRGVDVILNPSASHFAFGKKEIRKRFVLEGSRAFGVTYVYANLLGNEAGRAIYDGGAMIATGGEVVASGKRFGYEDWDLTVAMVDVEQTRMGQAKTASFRPDLREDRKDVVSVGFEYPILSWEGRGRGMHLEEWEGSSRMKEEEFTRAVALALFDYMRKSRSRGFVVSMSGGADSAAVSCLVGWMVRLGLEGLGEKRFAEKLAFLGEKPMAVEGWMALLLRCVYQGTRNSSEVTRRAAEEVTRALGGRFMEWDVDGLVEGYRRMVEASLGRELSWERDDVALQNIQARVRSPSVWMLANIENGLLLSTSNRSEAAVGYATMDGDTSGGLSPVAGIDKAFLRKWLEWLRDFGPRGFKAIPELKWVTDQAPTAELRPQERGQTDESDLMPYEVLDAIERAAIRDKLSPLECMQRVEDEFQEYEFDQMKGWVAKFFRLWCRNQWKRERYAPSFHVDDKNLDPKTWCRFPILSGGFEVELRELGLLEKTPPRVRGKEKRSADIPVRRKTTPRVRGKE